jgi:hypothetical protein
MIALLLLSGLALAAVALFVASELTCRAWLARHGRYHVWPPGARRAMELDREALPDLPPLARFEVNAVGERGAELPADLADTYRVLVAGGSAAECYFLDQPTTWPEQLRAELATPEALARLGTGAVHVGNVGRSLVACEHVRVLLERTLDRYERLDALVLMVAASDLVFWLERGTPSVLADEPLTTERLFGMHPEGPFGWGPTKLAMRRIASYWRHVLTHPVARRTEVGKSLTAKRAMRANAERIVDDVPDPDPMLDHFERHFRKLIELGLAKAERVVVARQPWFGREYSEEEERRMWQFGAGRLHTDKVTTYYAHAVAWRLMGQIDERAAAIAEELGAEQVDLMSVVARNLEHYSDEMHHTPAGCAVIGRAVAQRILAGRPTAPASETNATRPSRDARGARRGTC